jgi:hypothetical protein
MSPGDLTLAGIIAGAVVLVVMICVGLPVVLSMRQAARNREFEHAERLKALELGRPMPGDRATEVATRNTHNGIVLWVPLGALGIALGAMNSTGDSTAAVIAIWAAAGAVGVTGVICGTILAMRAPSPEVPAPRHLFSTKAPTEDDAVDTVSRRGGA